MSPMMKAHSTLDMLKQKPKSSVEFKSDTLIGVPKTLKPQKEKKNWYKIISSFYS